MYKIGKNHDDVALLCHDRAHVERVDAFNENSSTRRTQAARAMQDQSRDKHDAGSVLKHIPQTTERWGSSKCLLDGFFRHSPDERHLTPQCIGR
jgi:hypothetical protein